MIKAFVCICNSPDQWLDFIVRDWLVYRTIYIEVYLTRSTAVNQLIYALVISFICLWGYSGLVDHP